MGHARLFILVPLLVVLAAFSGLVRAGAGVLHLGHVHSGDALPAHHGHDHDHEHDHSPLTAFPVHEHAPGIPCHVHLPVVEAAAPKAERASAPAEAVDDVGVDAPRVAMARRVWPAMDRGRAAKFDGPGGLSSVQRLRTVRLVV